MLTGIYKLVYLGQADITTDQWSTSLLDHHLGQVARAAFPEIMIQLFLRKTDIFGSLDNDN